MDCSCEVAKNSIICHSERSEESRYHKVCVTEILPPYGRLNDNFVLTNMSFPFLFPSQEGRTLLPTKCLEIAICTFFLDFRLGEIHTWMEDFF